MTREAIKEWIINHYGATLNDGTKHSEVIQGVLEILEQESCEDAISRQAVLETIDSRIEQIKKNADAINESYSHLSFAEGVHDGYCRLKCDLWSLPPVTPKQKMGRWIPVSERLPEDGDVVLVTFQPHYPSNLLFGGSHVVEVTFSLNSNVWKNGTILAWMPLPEPYKVDKESEE